MEIGAPGLYAWCMLLSRRFGFARHAPRIVSFMVLGLPIAGCFLTSEDPNAHPQNRRALEKLTPAECDKLKECNPEAFKRTYSSRDSCIEQLTNEVLAKVDGSADSSCDNRTLDKCVDDMASQPCNLDGSAPKFPCDC